MKYEVKKIKSLANHSILLLFLIIKLEYEHALPVSGVFIILNNL